MKSLKLTLILTILTLATFGQTPRYMLNGTYKTQGHAGYCAGRLIITKNNFDISIKLSDQEIKFSGKCTINGDTLILNDFETAGKEFCIETKYLITRSESNMELSGIEKTDFKCEECRTFRLLDKNTK